MLDRSKEIVPVVLRPSAFSMDAIPLAVEYGRSLEDILREFPELPPEIWTHGVIRVGGVEVPREYWSRVKPKPGSRHLVHIGVRVGGGGEGGKNIFATIASIALIVAVTAISGGVLGPTGALSISSTLFAAGSTSAALAAAGLSVVGALALSALTPTAAAIPGAESDNSGNTNLGSASIQGNVLAPFDPIPFVAGTHRVSPPHIIQPWSESVNDDQYVYAIVGLDGAHVFEDIRINNAPIEDFDPLDVEYEVRDVATDDTDITIITKQVYENQIGIELNPHKVKEDAGDELQDEGTPSNSYPTWKGSRSRKDPYEIWLSFAWPNLVMQTGSGTTAAGVPIRIRIRRVGDTAWINLPELHAQRERLQAFRGVVKLRFEAATVSLTRLDQAASTPPWRYALYLTDAENDEGFEVDSYFDLSSQNFADNVGSENGVAVIWLDPDIFPIGQYDVQVMRGYGHQASLFADVSYTYNSNTPYFFTHVPASSPPDIRVDQTKVASTTSLVSMSSVWNEYPLRQKGIALLAIKAKNIAVNSITMLATGYANTYDGTDWNRFEPTRNPAAWWRTIALGAKQQRPVIIEAQLDDESLEEWFEFCAAIEGTNSTDFTGETLASPPTGFTSRWETGSTANVTAEASLPSGRGPLFDRASGDNRSFWSYDAAGQLRDKEILVLVRPVTGSASTESMGIIARGSGAAASETGYRLNFNSSATDERDLIVLGKYVAGTFTSITSSSFLWDVDTNYYMRFRVVKSNIQARVWAEADDEPAEWLIDIIDTSIPNEGYSGAFLFFDDESFYLGSIEVNELGSVLECNSFFESGQSLSTVLRIIAATGHASVRLSDKIGVVIDNNRSQETPIQLFTQRNARGLTVRRAFPIIPDVLRIGYNDRDNDYQPREIFVYRKPASPTIVESINYVGITSESEARARATLDFKQLLRRGRLYTLDVDIENIYCVRGSLVYLVYDVLSRQYDAARVVSVQTSGPNVTGLTLDATLRLSSIGTLGGSYPAGVVVQLKDGTTITEEIDEETDSDTITFTTPFTIPAGDILEEKCLVAAGSLTTIEKRMLVLSVSPQDDHTATLTLVDAADPRQVCAPGPLSVSDPDGNLIYAPF